MKKIYCFALVMTLFIVQSCSSAGNKENVKPIDNIEAVQVSVVDYGNGVFYFDKTKSFFGNTLSSFIKTHPELELVSIAGDGTRGAYGAEAGYFVVFKNITKK